jgi:hypothetical protein
MPKQIVIEVPDEVEKLIKENPKLKELITHEVVNRIAYAKMVEGSISKELLNIVAEVEDVHLKDEEKILEMLRNKAKERVKW